MTVGTERLMLTLSHLLRTASRESVPGRSSLAKLPWAAAGGVARGPLRRMAIRVSRWRITLERSADRWRRHLPSPRPAPPRCGIGLPALRIVRFDFFEPLRRL
ncbi:MAG: hypothetical protein GTO03_03360 [Planctomycetales bacterium]|nr:hypothetical protein [Planctomycetales bacterium]